MPYLEEKPPLDELVEELYHYGVKRRSGRYPYGSGEDPYQHSGDFASRVQELKKQGLTESQIAKELGIVNEKGQPSSTKLRAQLAIAKEERRRLDIEKVKALKEDGLSGNEIAKITGIPESTQRSLMNATSEARMNAARNTAEGLKKLVAEKGMIDVGTGVAAELRVSNEKLNQALEILKIEGYEVHGGRVPQVTNAGQLTTLKVLCPPGTPHKDIYNYGDIHSVADYISRDGGDTFEKKFHYPSSLDSKRLQIRYADDVGPDGAKGIEKDGVIELRRGVQDLSLGESRYSQVRILVDGTHYLKGMAVYSDNMPDGVDVIFNTNKTKDVPMNKVLKEIKKDPDNPFGSAIKDVELGGQYWYTDKNGKKQLGLINKRSDEGDWSDWKDKLPSQFLSKQNLSLAKKQLKMASDDKMAEYEEICSLTNPTVKKRLLDTFANDCDSAAVHLYAAALPRQKYHVIIPINSLKDNEIYAPNYDDGEQLALIRYPHGGTFEIPIVTVNNKNKVAKNLLGADIPDAVGINSRVAERLSGADFDGDTVMVIPTNDKVKITSTKQLADLEGFDPKVDYKTTEKDGKYYNKYGQEVQIMRNTQNEMGRISNLITDMTLQNAKSSELAKAVKHSMVVIDAEKHKLDYKSSYIENDIATLKERYQSGGASTLISRAKSQASVDKRQGSPKVNIKGSKDYDPSKPEGALLYKTADDLYYVDREKDKSTGLVTVRTTAGKKVTYDPKNKDDYDKYNPVKKVDPDTGEVSYTNKAGDISYRVKTRSQRSTKMAETDDAYTLVSEADTPMERAYADYANKMKALANQARKEMVTSGKIAYSSTAAKTYSAEVEELNKKLLKAEKNAPRERQAQTIANSVVKAKKDANPDMTKDEEKKIRQQELSKARLSVGAKRETIQITDKEWEAIQAGAISENKLSKILNNTDIDVIREKATPRSTKAMSSAKISRMKSMASRGYTMSEIAKAMGVSTSTVDKYL